MKFILKFVWVYVNILCDYIDGSEKKKVRLVDGKKIILILWKMINLLIVYCLFL